MYEGIRSPTIVKYLFIQLSELNMLFNFGVHAQDPVLKPSGYSTSSLAHYLLLIDLAWFKIALMMYARNTLSTARLHHRFKLQKVCCGIYLARVINQL